MKFGLCLPNYGRSTTFDRIRQVALLAEQLGYASVWTTDHVAVPQENIEPYGNIYESLTILAMAAMLTRRVQLGTSILVLPQRDPVLAAKQIATIDRASGGRMIVGVGAGWNEREYRHLGADFHTRGKRLDEDIRLLRALWSRENVSFEGRWTQLDHVMSAPLPAQDSHLPIWIGGNEEPSLRRAAELGDGWQTTGASPDQIAQGVRRIDELHTANQRGSESNLANKRINESDAGNERIESGGLTISARLSIDINPDTPATYQYLGHPRHRLAGTLDVIRARLGEYRAAGVEHIALVFPDDAATAQAQIEQFAREIMPQF